MEGNHVHVKKTTKSTDQKAVGWLQGQPIQGKLGWAILKGGFPMLLMSSLQGGTQAQVCCVDNY